MWLEEQYVLEILKKSFFVFKVIIFEWPAGENVNMVNSLRNQLQRANIYNLIVISLPTQISF